jgi:biopolymer transport protein ExbD
MAKQHSAESEDHGIDLAPMLDFTINLLIFFIITTSFVKEPGVEVFKPVASTAEERPKGNLMVAIRENGDVWLDRQPVDLRELRGIIERLHVERPEDSVVIIADRASRAGMVAKVMDEVRAGGIKDVAIAADTETGG